MPFILMYWKQILYGIVAIVVAGVIYYYGSYIPNKLKESEARNKALQEQASIDKKTLNLQNDTQKEKDKINKDVQGRLSSIHSKLIPRKSVLIKGGGTLH